ncbi:MAG: hypothetical protein JSV03_00575 [Planctomycetota bacterium]|nr:MAG: hypothetical protein JSV03_00575 [Planctomycetota bacterium]
MIQSTGTEMAPDKNKLHGNKQHPGQMTTLQRNSRSQIESFETQSRGVGPIPADILQLAVDLALKRIRFITREIALNFHQTEPIKRLAWQQLHHSEITVTNVATILETWAHRQIATFGDNARPDRKALNQWANEIDNTLQKALNALSDSTA